MKRKKTFILLLFSLNFCLQTEKFSFDFKNNPLFGIGFAVWSDANSKYTLGGSFKGFSSGSLILTLNGTDETFAPSSNYTFSQKLSSGTAYTVTVKTNPTGYVCSVSNGSGTLGSSSVTNINLSCALITVTAAYTTNGSNWNDYINRDFTKDIFAQTDTACNTANTGGYRTCVHAGEIRKMDLPSRTSCTTLTASDDQSALNWVCRTNTSGTVTFYSSGLKKGKYLSDLIDWTTNSWKSLTVTVKDGTATHAVSSALKLWSNVIDASETGSPSIAGTVYLYKTSPNAAINISSSTNKIAVLLKPGTVFRLGTASNAMDFHGMFNWVEGSLMNNTNATGLLMNTRFSAVKNFRTQNIGKLSTNSYGISVSGNYGNNLLEDINTSNTGGGVLNYGIYFTSSKDNIIISPVSANNQGDGINFDTASSGNSIIGAVAFNNGGSGVLFGGGLLTDSFVADITSVNNTTDGLNASGAYQMMTNIASVNNGSNGLYGSPISNPDIQNASMISNAGGLYVSGSGNFYGRGMIRGSGNTTNCPYATSFTGITSGTCAMSAPSDSISFLTTGSVGSSFSGFPAADSKNTSGFNGSTLTYTSGFDWLSFDTTFKGIGLYNSAAFPSTLHRGQCSGTNPCAIWDFSLKSTDTVLRNANITGGGTGCPTSSSVFTHTYSTGSVTVLRNAVEIIGDGVGNENGICESNEDCLLTPNHGAYQGHGNLVKSSTLSGGCAD
ncbi:MAG TPA: hypothetical protein PKA14_01790, partial [Leptospiraceae bacterium]|nr:hypothetical protein [Leptospiraceae bacterium]